MIKQKVEKALNQQLNQELFSSYTYLAMSAYFEQRNLSGFAAWFRMQSQEENEHAMKIFDYLHQRGGKVKLDAIDSAKSGWKSDLAVFKDMYEAEKKVSKSIDDLVELTLTEKDHATHNFLQWFVSEQVEEEAMAEELRDKMEMIGDNKSALFLFDRELGARGAGK